MPALHYRRLDVALGRIEQVSRKPRREAPQERRQGFPEVAGELPAKGLSGADVCRPPGPDPGLDEAPADIHCKAAAGGVSVETYQAWANELHVGLPSIRTATTSFGDPSLAQVDTTWYTRFVVKSRFESMFTFSTEFRDKPAPELGRGFSERSACRTSGSSRIWARAVIGVFSSCTI